MVIAARGWSSGGSLTGRSSPQLSTRIALPQRSGTERPATTFSTDGVYLAVPKNFRTEGGTRTEGGSSARATHHAQGGTRGRSSLKW